MRRRITGLLLVLSLLISVFAGTSGAESDELAQLKAEIWRLIPMVQPRTRALVNATVLEGKAAAMERYLLQVDRNPFNQQLLEDRGASAILSAHPRPTFVDLIELERVAIAKYASYKSRPTSVQTYEERIRWERERLTADLRLRSVRSAMRRFYTDDGALGRMVAAREGPREADHERRRLADLRTEIAALYAAAEELRPVAERLHGLQERAFQLITAGLPEKPFSIDVNLYWDGRPPQMRVGDRDRTLHTAELKVDANGRTWVNHRELIQGTGLWWKDTNLLTRYPEINDWGFRDWLGNEVLVLRGSFTAEEPPDCTLLLIAAEKRTCVKGRGDDTLPIGLVLRALKWREQRIETETGVTYRFQPPTSMLDIDVTSALMDRLGEVGIRIYIGGATVDFMDRLGKEFNQATLAGRPFNYHIHDTGVVLYTRRVVYGILMVGLQNVQGCTEESDFRADRMKNRNVIMQTMPWTIEVSARLDRTCNELQDDIGQFQSLMGWDSAANYSMYFLPTRVRLGLDHSLAAFAELMAFAEQDQTLDEYAPNRLVYLSSYDADMLDYARRGGKVGPLRSLTWALGPASGLTANDLTQARPRLSLAEAPYFNPDPDVMRKLTAQGFTTNEAVSELVSSIMTFGRTAVYVVGEEVSILAFDLGWLVEFEPGVGFKGLRAMTAAEFDRLVKGPANPGIGLEVVRFGIVGAGW